jgi:hypothetical protein
VARVALAGWCTLAVFLLAPVAAAAGEPPFRTVVGPLTPAVAGLTISGAPSGCSVFLLNQTGQDVTLLDDGAPPLARKFTSVPKSSVTPPAQLVPLVGNWKCAALPGVTEDQAWNHVPVTVLNWTLRGLVGAVSFKASVQTIYDPELDPTAGFLSNLRLGATVAAIGGLVLGIPYLLMRRRQLLAP